MYCACLLTLSFGFSWEGGFGTTGAAGFSATLLLRDDDLTVCFIRGERKDDNLFSGIRGTEGFDITNVELFEAASDVFKILLSVEIKLTPFDACPLEPEGRSRLCDERSAFISSTRERGVRRRLWVLILEENIIKG